MACGNVCRYAYQKDSQMLYMHYLKTQRRISNFKKCQTIIKNCLILNAYLLNKKSYFG